MYGNLNFANYKLFWQNNKEPYPPPKAWQSKKKLQQIQRRRLKIHLAKLIPKIYNWEIVIAKSWKIKLLKKVVEIFEKLNVHKHINMMRKMHEEKHNVKNEDINIMQRVEVKTQKPKITMHIYIF